MKVLLSWIREFVDVTASAEEIGRVMSMRGLALEGLDPLPPLPSPREDGDTPPDAVLDFDVTANRPDCLSTIGIAREIATAFSLPLRTPDDAYRDDPASWGTSYSKANLAIAIEEPELCARYAGAVADVTVGPSPAWMQARLAACGIRPINNVVDVTNYVLIELGQPMHAFDYERLAGASIVVRRARAGERLTTLDGRERALTPEMLVIADAERASAIAGVMGGAASEVSSGTRRIALESAWFNPRSVRATSKALGLRTEASYRFERGADVSGAVMAMGRALQLLGQIGAGHSPGAIVDIYPARHQPRTLALDPAAVRRLLGMDVPDAEAERILRSLGFNVRMLGGWQASTPDAAAPMGAAGQTWQVRVPAWRHDVQRPVDLIEEIGRHHGFEHLPATFPGVEAAPPPSDARIARDARARRVLLASGFSEAITFAFIDAAAATAFAAGEQPIAIANPLSEKFTHLRPSLLAGLVDAVGHNRRHGRRDVRLFEIGTRFSRRGETRGAAAVWTGAAATEHWSGGTRAVDFFDVKGVAEMVCRTMGVTPSWAPGARPYLVEGRTATLSAGDQELGVVGQLDPAIGEVRDLPAADPVYVLELDLDAITRQAPAGAVFAVPLPRHPAVVRDVSILVDDGLSAERVRGTIRNAKPPALVDIREFDRYQGKGISEGKVSLSLHLTFQLPDRTLTDAEVQSAMQLVLDALTRELGAIQR